MPYYPKNRIETNLYTRGREFSVTITGEEYIGYYYKLYNGTFFTGKTPDDTPTQELIPLVSQPIKESPIIVTLNQSEDKNLKNYVNLLKNTPEDKKLPIPYYPKPTKENYELGEIQRYFAKKINEAIFIEIGQKDFNNLIEENNAYLWQYYVTFSIPWEISGRKNEVENINKKIVALAEFNNKVLGFNNYIKKTGGYTKYYLFPNISNLYTAGGEFETANGQNYIGFYHIHDKTGPMIGATHTKEPHGLLFPINEDIVSQVINQQTPQIITQTTSSYTPPPMNMGGGGFSGGGGGGY